jgi:hypothetical protein
MISLRAYEAITSESSDENYGEKYICSPRTFQVPLSVRLSENCLEKWSEKYNS